MKNLSLYKTIMIVLWILFMPVLPMVFASIIENTNNDVIAVILRIIWVLAFIAAIVFTVLYVKEKKKAKNAKPAAGNNRVMPQNGKYVNDANKASTLSPREQLLRDYRSVIAGRFPKEILEFNVHKALFNNLNNVLNAAYTMITVTGNPFDRAERSVDGGKSLAVMLVMELNQYLAVLNDEKAIEEWKNCTDEQLIDAFILLDFYSEVIQNLDIENVKKYRDYLAKELFARFEKGNVAKDKPETKSVASGRKEVEEAEGIEFINQLEKVYVMYSATTGEKYPSVDMNGFAWVFSKIEFAEYSQQQNAEFNLRFREMTLPAFKEFVKEWYAYGVYHFKLNPGINDIYSEIQRDVFMPDENAKMFDYYGSNLNQSILRFKQTRACESDKNVLALAQTFWSSICHELYKTVFLVPVSYDDEPDDAVDNYIHYTENAVKIVNYIEVKRELGDSFKDGKDIEVDCNGIISNEKLILGSDGYKYASPETSVSGRTMHLRTLTNGTTSMLCGFTDIRDIHRIFGENLHIALMSYEDILSHIDSPISDGNTIVGIVINAGANELVLNRENIAFAAKESKEKIKIYVAGE